MANRHKGDVSVKVGEREFIFRFSIDALCQLEEQTGKTIIEIGQILNSGRIGVTLTRSLVWAALREHHPEITLKEAGEMLPDMGGAVGAMGPITQAFGAAFPERSGKQENPPKPDQDGTGPAS